MSTIRTTILVLFLSASCVLSMLFAPPAHAGASPNRCPGVTAAVATTVIAGTTLRSYGEELVQVEAERAGLLSLDLLAPASASTRGRLISGTRANDWQLERSARHLVLAVPAAGSWTFRVASEDPRRQLGAWRLRTGFVPAVTITEESSVASDGRRQWARQLRFDTADSDPFAGSVAGDPLRAVITVLAATEGKTDEMEIDPDPFTGGCDLLMKTDEMEIDPDPFTGGCDLLLKTDEMEIDPDPFTGGCDPLLKTDEMEIDPDPFAGGCDPLTKTDEMEIDPDPFAGWVVRGFRTSPKGAELAPLAEHRIADPSCHLDTGDDHGDTPGCATAVVVGQELTAELGNGWGDDADVFAFTLRKAGTVTFETRGGTDTVGTLYDRYGHRLATDDDGGSGGSFRLVKVLAPGRYFLRVEGAAGAEGAYLLAFAAALF